MAFGLDDFLGNFASSAISNMFAADSREDTQAFNAEQAAQSRAFSREMMQNKYQWQVKDLEAAGLNPMLAYGQSPGMAGSAAASSGTQGTHDMASYSTAKMTASQVALNDAQEKKIAAETDRTRAEEQEIKARTPTYAVNIDQMRQQIDQSKATIENLLQQTKTGAASAQLMEAQTRQVNELIPQIKAQVAQLEALAALNLEQINTQKSQQSLQGAQAAAARAQAAQLKALEGLTADQQKEVIQRVKANLPNLQSALQELDRQAKILAMPGRYGESAMQESYIGALGRTLRALNPFSDFMHAAPQATYRGQ